MNDDLNKYLYLFLDFDGCLHHFFPVPGVPDSENAHFFFKPAFEETVRDIGLDRVRIVISSTWRRKHPLQEIRAFFSDDIGAIIIDGTPFVGSGNGPGGRLCEVQSWLAQNNLEDAPWIGIDDFPSLYGEGAVVVCHDQFGDRERALLLEASQDPKLFAQKYPCEQHGTPKKYSL